MSGFQFDLHEPTEGPNFLKVPGFYLLEVTDIQLGKNLKGEPIPDGFTVRAKVVGSETPDVVGSLASFLCRRGRPTDRNKEFQDNRIRAFGVAMNQIEPGAGTGRGSLDVDKMKGQLFVAEFEKDDKGNCWLRFNEIFHVDDPKGSGKHLDPVVVGRIPGHYRRPAEDFKRKTKSQGTGESSKPNPFASL